MKLMMKIFLMIMISLSLSVLNSLLDCIMLSTTQNTAESASKDLHPTSICLKKNTL